MILGDKIIIFILLYMNNIVLKGKFYVLRCDVENFFNFNIID